MTYFHSLKQSQIMVDDNLTDQKIIADSEARIDQIMTPAVTKALDNMLARHNRNAGDADALEIMTDFQLDLSGYAAVVFQSMSNDYWVIPDNLANLGDEYPDMQADLDRIQTMIKQVA